MIKLLKNGSIYDKIVATNATGVFIALFYNDKKIDILFPIENRSNEILDAYYNFLIERKIPKEFLKKVEDSFFDFHMLSCVATIYLCCRDIHFSHVFTFSVDETNFFRLISRSDIKKYL